jgi:hypothetical protein
VAGTATVLVQVWLDQSQGGGKHVFLYLSMLSANKEKQM